MIQRRYISINYRISLIHWVKIAELEVCCQSLLCELRHIGDFSRLFIYLLCLFASALDCNKARVGIQEVHFLPFNPTDKRTALTYIDSEGKMHRVSKGAPEQVRLYTTILCTFMLLDF